MSEAAGGRAEQMHAAGQQAQAEEQAAKPEQPQATVENPLAKMRASDVIGAEVKNQEGDDVAEIADLVKQPGADEVYAVLSVGGFLGLGEKKVIVLLDELQVGPEGKIVMANASEERLKQMAGRRGRLREHGWARATNASAAVIDCGGARLMPGCCGRRPGLSAAAFTVRRP
jgi:hypothetical protein